MYLLRPVVFVVVGGLAFWLATCGRDPGVPSQAAPNDGGRADVTRSTAGQGGNSDPVEAERQDLTPESPPKPRSIIGLAALEEAKQTSALGPLEDWELSSLLELLSNLERGSEERLHGYISSGGIVGGVEHADYVFDLEGARAKSIALLSNSYLLLRPNEDLPTAISGDSRLHLVQGPGFTRNKMPFMTHIVIDLQEQGRFAEAKKTLERMLQERKAASEQGQSGR